MRILTRVMIQEMLVAAGLTAAALLGLITLGRMLQLRELFLVQGVGAMHMLRLFFYLTPFFLTVLVPAASMLAVYLTVTRMGTDREIVALRAAGVGIGPLVTPSLVVCLVGAAITVWAGFWGVAWGMERFRNTIMELARQQTMVRIQPGVFTQVGPGITMYAREVSPSGGQLADVFVHDASKAEALTITAPQGRLAVDRSAGRLVVALERGAMVREGASGISRVRFAHYVVSLDLSGVLSGVRLGEVSPKEMGWMELWQLYRQRHSLEDANLARRVAIEVHKRPALAGACLLLGLTMLAVALVFSGISRQWGLVVGMGVFFLYYVLLSAGMSLAEGGVLAPGVGVWSPSVLFAVVAALLLRAAATERWITVTWRRAGRAA
ncbi:MAG: export transporter permease LptF [Desulfomicrobiaceae bacterium]|nr:export transporter permease LptF [Desulfomicrobiaceae bacterium]MDI3492647.1 lipopolysaccharide export system permease protein [Desulfomicrobiaceae bacterium]